MSNYNSLKATINANIKQNGNQEITGQILNSVLNQMVTTLGAGYQFAGVATIATNPGTPDAKVFYIANGNGTYEKFGGINVTEDEVVVLYWDSAWHKVATGIASQAKLSELESKTWKYVNSPEYCRVYTDAEGKFLMGIKADGSIEWAKGVPAPIKERLKHIEGITTEPSTEFMKVVVDDADHIIYGVKADGSVVFYSKVDMKADTSLENLTLKNGYRQFATDNPQYTEVLTDAEGKILKSRDAKGVETIHYPLFVKKLEVETLMNGAKYGDLSSEKSLHIAMPKYAIINFLGFASMPTTKTANIKAEMEYQDTNGVYFKKECIVNAQGTSSLAHPKKNISLDLFNDITDDNVFKLKFGEWVEQDSFHLKAYYNDPFRGVGVVAYKLYNQIVKTRGELSDYVWKRAMFDIGEITSTSVPNFNKKMYSNGATCFPDGFPIIVYLNGEFYGIFSWQIKKHRDNYRMSKSNPKHIHLDGVIGAASLFDANGDKNKINWSNGSTTGFEIRNPKGLILMDGSKYDADTNAGELIDASSAQYDASNYDHVLTAEVKAHIVNLSKCMSEIQEASKQGATSVKSFIEERFDVDNLIDYIIFSDVCANYDGFLKNWQWITYDGVKWFIVPYDTDGTFGNWWELTDYIYPPLKAHQNASLMLPYIYEHYNSELQSRYKSLRDAGIISTNNITALLDEWILTIGFENFEKEWEKWPDFIKKDSPLRFGKWVAESIRNMDSLYNY